MRNLFSTKSLLGMALAAAIGTQAQAAMLVNENIEGNWYNPQQGGRGVMVDYLPTGPGAGVLFIAWFTYDEQGNGIWLISQANVAEGQFRFNNVPTGRFNGGRFGNTFTAPTAAQVGTTNIVFNSCSDLRMDFTPGTGSNLPPVNLTLQPLGSLGAKCAYTTAFTSCPAGTAAVPNAERTCRLPNTITGNLRLPNNATYVIDGPTLVGGGFNTGAATLTIDPGTLLIGSGAPSSYLGVQAGSRIFAEGTENAPIIFTGPTPTNGSWAGLAIAGNSVCNDSQSGQPCQFEAAPEIRFGGTATTESSGVLRYVQIRYAGQEIRPNEEFNSLTLLGVGSGTTVEYVQVYGGKDDAFEMFGGTVNGRYWVSIGAEDDAFDTDLGYSGRVQYFYAKQTTGVNNDSNGIESDGNRNNNDLTPRTNYTLTNFTLIGAAGGNEGIRLRRGSGGQHFKGVVVGFNGESLNFNDAATFVQAGTPQALGTGLTMRDMFLSSNTNFEDSTSDPYLISDWYNVGGQARNNRVGPNPLIVNGNVSSPFPNGSTLSLGTTSAPEIYFNATNFIGAFPPGSTAINNWAAGWTYDFQ